MSRIVAKIIEDNAIIARHLSSAAKSSVLESKIQRIFDLTSDFSAGTGTSSDVTDAFFSVSITSAHEGSSSQRGIVDAPLFNKCQIKDSTTNDPIEDGSNRQVFGRVTDTVTALTGTLTFTNGSTAVTGSGTAFTTELAVGEYIQLDADKTVGKIATITDDTNIVLDSNYVGTGGSGAGSQVELSISYLVDTGASEIAHTMGGETIDIIFPEAVNIEEMPFGSLASGIGFSDIQPASHDHDTLYYRKTELNADTGTTGGDLIGIDNTGYSNLTASTAQDLFDEIDGYLGVTAIDRRYEQLTIVTLNTIPTLANTPQTDSEVELSVFGLEQRNGSDFTVSGTTITWNAGTAGFDLDPSDVVIVKYFTV